MKTKPRRFFSSFFFLLAVLGFIIHAGCGRKSGPRPPEDTAPREVQYFIARGTVSGVSLSWYAPTKDASGDRLIDLEGFIVERSIYHQDESPDFEEIADVPAKSPEEEGLEEEAAQGDVVLEKRQAASQQAKEYTFEDTLVQAGEHYEYVVYPYNEDGVWGRPSVTLRGRFLGESSVFESITPSRR